MLRTSLSLRGTVFQASLLSNSSPRVPRTLSPMTLVELPNSLSTYVCSSSKFDLEAYWVLTDMIVGCSGSTTSLALTDLSPVFFLRLPAVSSRLTTSLPSSSPPTSLSVLRLSRRPRRPSLLSTRRAGLPPITISRLWRGLPPRVKSGWPRNKLGMSPFCDQRRRGSPFADGYFCQ